MTDLSPAAQAVMDAFLSEWDVYAVDNARYGMAAALRAAAEHCVPDDSEGHWVYIPRLLAIAAELDGTNSPSENG